MEETWLTQDEQRAWVGLVSAVAHLDVALDRQLRRDSGISHRTYAILAVVSAAPGRTLHMSDLATLTSSSQSRLSHGIASLEEAGWIRRTRCPHSKRVVHATLTQAGYDVVRSAAPGHVAEVRRLLFSRLTPGQVNEISTITAAALQALAEDGHQTPGAAVIGGCSAPGSPHP